MYQSALENPFWHDVRRLLAEGGLGKPVHAYARMAHRQGLNWNQGPDVWRLHRSMTGGGTFIMGAIHFVHLLQWLREQPIVRVCAIAKNAATPAHRGGRSPGCACRVRRRDDGHARIVLVRTRKRDVDLRHGRDGPVPGRGADRRGDGQRTLARRRVGSAAPQRGRPLHLCPTADRRIRTIR